MLSAYITVWKLTYYYKQLTFRDYKPVTNQTNCNKLRIYNTRQHYRMYDNDLYMSRYII